MNDEYFRDDWYDIRTFDIEQLKELFRYCADYASEVRVDKLDCNVSFSRQRTDLTLDDYLNDVLSEDDHHVFIHRKGSISQKNDDWNTWSWVLEIGGCTLAKDPDYFLHIIVPETELDHILLSFNLKSYAL